MASPTKPLYTVRFTLGNTRFYTVAQIMSAYAAPLKAAGYVIYQTPATRNYVAKYSLRKEGPYEGDPDGSIFETMVITGPDGKNTQIARDVVLDPKGSSPIVEARRAAITAIAWNLGPPKGATPKDLADLIWAIRRKTLFDTGKYTGFGWVPLANTWARTPVWRSPYPNRPPIPSVLLPEPKAPTYTPPVVAKPPTLPTAPTYTWDDEPPATADPGAPKKMGWPVWALGLVAVAALAGE